MTVEGRRKLEGWKNGNLNTNPAQASSIVLQPRRFLVTHPCPSLGKRGELISALLTAKEIYDSGV